MKEKEMIDLLQERLSDNYVSTNVEDMKIPVVTDELCVVLKKRVIVCHVNDEAKAMFALWRFVTNEFPCLFISTKRNTPTLLKDMFEEVIGTSIENIDLRKSSSLAGFGSFLDDFSKKKIYINDSAKRLNDKSIKDMIVTYDIKVVVADSFDV